MRPLLRLFFTDFWPNFSPVDFWLFQLLTKDFNVVLDQSDPDLLIFGDYGIQHLNHRCHKIYYSHENQSASSRLCDFSFCFHGKGKNHQYFPNFVEDPFFHEISSGFFGPELIALRTTPKTRFCNFIYSNGGPRERVEFCQQLMTYKHVDCPGKVLNNQPAFDSNAHKYCAGGAANSKTHFLKHYRFTIAFENESSPDYTTEKIFHAFVAGSIPIYWGNPNVARLFNPDSFINCHDFPNFAAVVDFVKAVDHSPSLLARYQNAAPILPQSCIASLTEDFLRARLRWIVASRTQSRSISQSSLFPVQRFVHFFSTRVRNRSIQAAETLQRILTRLSCRKERNPQLTPV